ncbi:hypothetical protein [Paractinoplanes rishiriensis]|uniref:Uncharacterized protein n=1 Tax=Paractinoplanes rishiriensis TaxID=1050105 RepID=A0A919K297_9ACTN|nr:hypothetical protein [Actinoplanes rishiriensis]GIE98114.1 hypothetical protein Ari01nite_55790 [Actinoplanes rishiriensis]
MIVVVTGPSAAGKTTWCQRLFPDDTVPECPPPPGQPSGIDPAETAAFWCEHDTRRWRHAVRREAAGGFAICDDDPMKLHYSWSMARLGALPPGHWRHEVDARREAMAAGRLGLADLFLVSVPSAVELRRRRDADPTRRRRNFDLHVRLAEPLREWYHAVERADPDRVRWQLPPEGLPADLPPPRADRCDPLLLDAVIAGLPQLD